MFLNCLTSSCSSFFNCWETFLCSAFAAAKAIWSPSCELTLSLLLLLLDNWSRGAFSSVKADVLTIASLEVSGGAFVVESDVTGGSGRSLDDCLVEAVCRSVGWEDPLGVGTELLLWGGGFLVARAERRGAAGFAVTDSVGDVTGDLLVVLGGGGGGTFFATAATASLSCCVGDGRRSCCWGVGDKLFAAGPTCNTFGPGSMLVGERACGMPWIGERTGESALGYEGSRLCGPKRPGMLSRGVFCSAGNVKVCSSFRRASSAVCCLPPGPWPWVCSWVWLWLWLLLGGTWITVWVPASKLRLWN